MSPIDHKQYPLSTNHILEAMRHGIIREPAMRISPMGGSDEWPTAPEVEPFPYIASLGTAHTVAVHLEDGTQLIDPSRLRNPNRWATMPLDVGAAGNTPSDLEGEGAEGSASRSL